MPEKRSLKGFSTSTLEHALKTTRSKTLLREISRELRIRKHRNPVSRSKALTILEHGKVRGRKLTPKQKRFFGARAGGAPVRNPKHLKCRVCGKGTTHTIYGGDRGFKRIPIHKACYAKLTQVKTVKPNPRGQVLIYGRVLKIFAQKTTGPYKGQRFVHTFKPGAVMVGMPDGSIRISHPGK